MLNEVEVLSIGGPNDTTASNSILLPLNRRDRVWIELSRGKLVEPYQFTDAHYNGPKKSGYTSFIGYLVGEISEDIINDTNNNEELFGDDMYEDYTNHDNAPLTNDYPNEYYPSHDYPNEYYPSNNPDQNKNQLIVIDTQRLPFKIKWDGKRNLRVRYCMFIFISFYSLLKLYGYKLEF